MKTLSQETRAKMREAAKRRWARPEEVAKTSSAAKKRWKNPEYRERIISSLRKVMNSEETKNRMKYSSLQRWSRPEEIEKASRGRLKLDVNEIGKAIVSGMSSKEVWEKFGCSQNSVKRAFERAGFRQPKYCSDMQKVKDGTCKTMYSGYLAVRRKGHPRATKQGHYVLQHILVAEKMLGRPLKAKEVVHHINFVRTDNRPENLMVMENGDHTKLHTQIRAFLWETLVNVASAQR